MRGWNLSAAVIVLLAALVGMAAADVPGRCPVVLKGIRLGMTRQSVLATLAKKQAERSDEGFFVFPDGWRMAFTWDGLTPPRVKEVRAWVRKSAINHGSLCVALSERYGRPFYGSCPLIHPQDRIAWSAERCLISLYAPSADRIELYLRWAENTRQKNAERQRRSTSILEDD